MEKVAVRCETREEADKCLRKRGVDIGGNTNISNQDWSSGRLYMDTLNASNYFGFHGKGWFHSYKIISAEEYLGGGEEVEFKVGDEVEVIRDVGSDAKKGMRLTISYTSVEKGKTAFNFKGEGFYLYPENIKHINSITKSKEEKVNTLLSKVLKKENLEDAQLVERFAHKIIGNMEDTLVNEHTLTKVGAKNLVEMAKKLQAEEDENS
jgi:hypothetical protein